MGDHQAPKTDPISKLAALLGGVALLITLGYFAVSFQATIKKNTLPDEVATNPKAPEAETEQAAAEAVTQTASAEPAAETGAAPAAEESASGGATAAKGADLYATSCTSCHGAEGQGQGMFPKVAGLPHDEIVSKLEAYRAGEQVGPQTAMMAPNAANLSDEDIESLALHLAGDGGSGGAAEPAAAASAGGGDAQAGADLYASSCASCHGADGQGQGTFPKVAGLAHSEIVSKLEAYRAGEQVGPQTALMAPNAANLSDADIANLAAHLSGGNGGGKAAADDGASADAAAAPAGNVSAGKDMFTAKCASCHGMQGAGQGMFPAVAGLSAADAAGKLEAYRAGEQVGPQTAMMAPNAASLSDEDIADLAAFIGQL